MGSTSETRTYDALMSLTLENYRKTLVDNIFASSVFLASLKKQNGGIRMVNGGERIRVPLLYGKNTTAKSYSGYDPLDTTPQDGITSTFAEWAQLAVSIAISRKEERQNNQEHQIKSLLEGKIMQAESSIKEELNWQLLGKTFSSSVATEGNGGKDLMPLTKIIPKAPTTGVIQTVNRANEAWWRSRSFDGSSNGSTSKDAAATRGWDLNTWAELRMAMKTTYNFAGRGGGGSPNMIITDQDGFENFENSLESKLQYQGPAEGRLAFDHLMFKPGCPIYWDEMVPDLENGVAYDSASAATSTFLFLNTEYVYLAIDTETNFVNTPFIRPVGQDAKVAEILFMGQLVATNCRKLACLYGVTRGLTS